MVSRLLEVLCQEIFRFYLSLANVSLFFLSDPQCLIFFLLVILMVRVVFAVTVQIPTFFISRIACLVFFFLVGGGGGGRETEVFSEIDGCCKM